MNASVTTRDKLMAAMKACAETHRSFHMGRITREERAARLLVQEAIVADYRATHEAEEAKRQSRAKAFWASLALETARVA